MGYMGRGVHQSGLTREVIAPSMTHVLPSPRPVLNPVDPRTDVSVLWRTIILKFSAARMFTCRRIMVLELFDNKASFGLQEICRNSKHRNFIRKFSLELFGF